MMAGSNLEGYLLSPSRTFLSSRHFQPGRRLRVNTGREAGSSPQTLDNPAGFILCYNKRASGSESEGYQC